MFSEWSSQLTPILAFWKKLNQSSDLLQTRVDQTKERNDPLLEMLSTELHFAIGLVNPGDCPYPLNISAKKNPCFFVPDSQGAQW